jgi:hypothetical protein
MLMYDTYLHSVHSGSNNGAVLRYLVEESVVGCGTCAETRGRRIILSIELKNSPFNIITNKKHHQAHE